MIKKNPIPNQTINGDKEMNLFGHGNTSAMNIHDRERHKVASDLGYRSYSHLRTKGKEDLLLCESEVAYNLAEKVKQLTEEQK